MTRSLGDDFAHTLGVISRPTLTQVKLHYESSFIVMASDGI